jgi:hypothetical protein
MTGPHPQRFTMVLLQVCSALGQIAKHSVDLAEVVVEAEVFPKCLTCLKYPDEFVRKHTATLVREVVKHTPELAQLVVANGGVGALVEYCNESNGNNRCVQNTSLPAAYNCYAPIAEHNSCAVCMSVSHALLSTTLGYASVGLLVTTRSSACLAFVQAACSDGSGLHRCLQ